MGTTPFVSSGATRVPPTQSEEEAPVQESGSARPFPRHFHRQNSCVERMMAVAIVWAANGASSPGAMTESSTTNPPPACLRKRHADCKGFHPPKRLRPAIEERLVQRAALPQNPPHRTQEAHDDQVSGAGLFGDCSGRDILTVVTSPGPAGKGIFGC